MMMLLAGCTDYGAQVRDGDDEKTYNLLEDGVEFEMVSQLSGTCWLCASSCAMSTGNRLNHGGNIVLDQYELLDEIYSDDKDEGVFLATGVDKKKFGGLAISVINQLSRGFGNGLVLDDSIDANEWTDNEIKMGIREHGALYVGIPDSKIGRYGGVVTMNYPDAEPGEFDHSIAVIGWDDDFPKENFMTQASKNGAWITYNSNYPGEYYYVSYDTPFDRLYDTPCFMSVTDEYSQVLSYDCGHWMTDPVSTGDETTTANFFTGKGKLSAVGTYVLANDTDLNIQIMTPDCKECLYSQKYHADLKGYHVFKLDTPMDVRAYVIAVTYSTGAPVEGESIVYDSTARVDIVSEMGQSYILVNDEWLDMSEQTTWDKVGCVTNNACIRALYTE